MNTPFTKDQFFSVFADYNAGVFPAQVIILLLTLFAWFRLVPSGRTSGQFVGWFLGALWIWTGLMYHVRFFSSINNIAPYFGILFILEGVLIVVASARGSLSFQGGKTLQKDVGHFLILFGLLLYPAIGYLTEYALNKIISVGLPCPSVIITFGFFLFAGERLPKYLLFLPTVWSIIGISAALNLGVYQDLMLIVSALTADYFLLRKKRFRGVAVT